MLVGLLRELMCGEMIAFSVGGCCGSVGVGGFVVILGGAVVRALRHGWAPLLVGCVCCVPGDFCSCLAFCGGGRGEPGLWSRDPEEGLADGEGALELEIGWVRG